MDNDISQAAEAATVVSRCNFSSKSCSFLRCNTVALQKVRLIFMEISVLHVGSLGEGDFFGSDSRFMLWRHNCLFVPENKKWRNKG